MDLLKNNNIEIESNNNETDNEITFDMSLLSDSTFKRLVNHYDSISGSPTEYIITGTIASLSGAIGKQAYFRISKSIKIYCNIYAMIIGKSSIMRKSSALSLTTNELQKIDDHNRYEYNINLSEYESKLSENKKSKDKGNYFDAEKPVRDYVMFPQDSTIESLTDILSNSTRGILVHNELGGWLASMNKGYAGDSKMFFTNIYDVPKSYEVSRIIKGSTYLHRPCLSICGASTISWLIENSTDSDLTSGFFARFIYSIRNKPTKKYLALLQLRNLTSRTENNFDVGAIYKRLSELDKIEIEITKEAMDYHIKYDVESFKELLSSENDSELSFKSRLLIYSLKFAMIICLTDNRATIELKDIKDGIALVDYYKRNVELLLSKELTQNEFTRNEDKILKLINSKGGQIERTKLMQLGNLKAKELDEVLINLIEKNLIEEAKGSRTKNNKVRRMYTTKIQSE